MYNLVIFASGNGSTLQSIIDNIKKGTLKAKINLVVSNNEKAYAIQRAKNSNINTYIIKNKTLESIDEELTQLLTNYKIDLIVLAGYLKMIGPKLIQNYKIINTHPSLLPKYGGKGMYGMKVHNAVVKAKEKFTGPTVHFVNNEYDKGNIISQTKIEILPDDTAEVVSEKVQAIEKIQLNQVLKKFIKEEEYKCLIK